MYILGISAYFHDSAACLLCDDRIVAAAQEERFSRIKNDEQFPASAITYCLKAAGIRLSEVDHVVFYEKPFLKFERLIETYLAMAPAGLLSYLKAMPVWIREKIFMKRNIIRALRAIDDAWAYNGDNLLFTEHHQSHAASAFFPSPFLDAYVLSVDGVGEWTTTSIWRGYGNKLDLVKEIRFPHSAGLLYSSFTYYLGFKVNSDEYKVMGLAPYGQPKYTNLILDELIDLKPDGSFRLDMRYFNYCTGLTMTNDRFAALFGYPARKKEEELLQFHMDIAASIQTVTSEIMLRLVSHLKVVYGARNICLSGGVALNCVINGKILEQYPSDGLWIQPAAGDAGAALGAAYAVYYQHLDNNRRTTAQDKMESALLGPSYTRDEVAAVLSARSMRFIRYEDEAFYKRIAMYLDQGKVIGWFNGRMEFGPRALGARSIIADSRKPGMQSLINGKIKFRESFRPFAPAVLEEQAANYFTLSQKSPYMLLVGSVRHQHRLETSAKQENFKEHINQIRSSIPAVTHVDFTARIQTVNAADHPGFHRLLQQFYQLTGCPVIVNTSFNVMDQPVVCSPRDALDCFLQSELDVLAIENFIVLKTMSPSVTLQHLQDEIKADEYFDKKPRKS
jgi:carbamoyltransferase